ncbi:MAG: hypothetical protein EOR97_05320 [Mesorhizobium sp.]|uniref:hypothetical protein n=1 Tax=Mesorhizobium sp. TaxID=1871066 RepID=UPI000FE87D89|nr:hypothetical protein [Mesorhizobium sp.]RWN34177.1 MAG: hypothetical protein EOR97_05320 [Mesorhizobium sp.]
MAKKFDISDDERLAMIHNGDLMEDTYGNEMFTGMTSEESEEFWPLRQAAIAGGGMDEVSRSRYQELVAKREKRRQQLLLEEFKAKSSGRLT